jgi:hypothetical protein
MKVVIRNEEQLRRTLRSIGVMSFTQPVVIELKPHRLSKTREQENKFHAMCRDLSLQGIQWGGKPRTADEWKVLVKSAVHHMRKGETHVVAGLEGEVVELLQSTTKWTRKDYSEAIEYLLAFGAEHNVRWREE